jgi:hypothetical protein
MVTHLEYSIIWFIFFTSSFSSSSSCCARDMVAPSLTVCSMDDSVGCALRLDSSSMRSILSLRTRLTDCAASRFASACALASAMSSALMTGDGLSMRCRSAAVTVTTPARGSLLFVFAAECLSFASMVSPYSAWVRVCVCACACGVACCMCQMPNSGARVERPPPTLRYTQSHAHARAVHQPTVECTTGFALLLPNRLSSTNEFFGAALYLWWNNANAAVRGSGAGEGEA